MRFVSLLKICNKYLEELDQVVGVEEFAEPQFSGLSQLRDVAEG